LLDRTEVHRPAIEHGENLGGKARQSQVPPWLRKVCSMTRRQIPATITWAREGVTLLAPATAVAALTG